MIGKIKIGLPGWSIDKMTEFSFGSVQESAENFCFSHLDVDCSQLIGINEDGAQFSAEMVKYCVDSVTGYSYRGCTVATRATN